MLKFTAELQDGGNLYGFGLTETNLNRLEFNDEPILFSFDFIGHPDIYALIFYLGFKFKKPEDIAKNIDFVENCCASFAREKGISPEALRIFPIAKTVMQKLRDTPLWGFDNVKVEITHPNDKQLIFSGRTEQELRDFFMQSGFVKPQTKQIYKGFEKRDL
ncbi:hypothetical protein LC593_10785 [Nostoc sp. CHAB 5844]|nr:hypothetical protein [Nostoc sp. CHAB 5844]